MSMQAITGLNIYSNIISYDPSKQTGSEPWILPVKDKADALQPPQTLRYLHDLHFPSRLNRML